MRSVINTFYLDQFSLSRSHLKMHMDLNGIFAVMQNHLFIHLLQEMKSEYKLGGIIETN